MLALSIHLPSYLFSVRFLVLSLEINHTHKRTNSGNRHTINLPNWANNSTSTLRFPFTPFKRLSYNLSFLNVLLNKHVTKRFTNTSGVQNWFPGVHPCNGTPIGLELSYTQMLGLWIRSRQLLMQIFYLIYDICVWLALL